MEWNFCISLSVFKRVRKYCTLKALLYWILLKYLQKYIFQFNKVSLLSQKLSVYVTETGSINLQFLCNICLLPTVLLTSIMRKRKIFRRFWHEWEEPDFPKCLILLYEAENVENTLTSRNCQHQILRRTHRVISFSSFDLSGFPDHNKFEPWTMMFVNQTRNPSKVALLTFLDIPVPKHLSIWEPY